MVELYRGQSNEFIVVLPRYELQWSFRKNKIRELYPECLFSLTMDQDPNASVLELTMPIITPGVMRMVAVLIEEDGAVPNRMQDVLTDVTFRMNLFQASRYLLIPELGLFSDLEFFNHTRKVSFSFMIGPDTLESYSWIVDQIIQSDDHLPAYRRYMMDRVPYGKTIREDTLVYYWAVKNGRLELMQELIQRRHVDPTTCILTGEAFNELEIKVENWDHLCACPSLELVCIYGHEDVARWLIQTYPPLLEEADTSYGPLEYAVEFRHLSIVLFLLKQCQYDTEAVTNILLNIPFKDDKDEELVLGHPQIQEIFQVIIHNQKAGTDIISKMIPLWKKFADDIVQSYCSS